ncbi:ABC transporter permease [Serinibacter arcticus]|uniref:ABC transporter permease n=1 Tax=Serinibacter arcticus TaxID=1655435 RepID=UPI0022A79D68|nr:ABC transporter permease [Serinibacter arcticus]
MTTTDARAAQRRTPDPPGPGRPSGATSRRRRPGRVWYREPRLVTGLAVLAVVALATLVGPLLLPYGPNEIDLLQLERPPSPEHVLGTDDLGRDVLARLLHGGRLSIMVGLAAALVQLVVGVTVGAVSGYVGGWVDSTLMRITEIFMCFPFYSIAVTLAGLFGASIWNVVLIIGLLSWTGLARLVRAEVLSLREREFVLFARASGVPAPASSPGTCCATPRDRSW